MSKYKFKTSKKLKSNLEFNIPKIKRDNKKPIFTFCDFIKNTSFYTKEHSNENKNELFNFLNSIQDFCTHTWFEIKQNTHTFHCHEIEENNANIPELAVFDESTPFVQFKLPNHQEGRFIGYFDNEDIFHIVLYDRKHKVYKRK